MKLSEYIKSLKEFLKATGSKILAFPFLIEAQIIDLILSFIVGDK